MIADHPRLDLLRHTPLNVGLDENELAEIAVCARPFQVEAGVPVVLEGAPSDCWYLIVEGTVRVTRRDLVGESTTLAVLGPGDSFGEAALLEQPLVRSATVTALTPVEGWVVNGSEFRAHVSFAAQIAERLARRLDMLAVDTALKRASPFAALPNAALQSLSERLEAREARTGEDVVRQGEHGDCVFVIRTGSVEVLQDGKHLAFLGPGDSFGEAALLTGKPRSATVRSLEATELLALKRADFIEVAQQYAAVSAYFRELLSARFRGALDQPLLLPDPVSTMMPRLGPRGRKRCWAVLTAGFVLFLVLTTIAEFTELPILVYPLTVVGALVVPVVFVFYLAESNLLAERPVELLTTGLLGAALGLPPAYLIQRASGLLPGSWTASLSIAVIEELAKLLGILWLLRRPELRFRMDGVIFGAAAGMGFAALESMLYGFARAETVGALVGVLAFRAFMAPFSHGTWTAIVSATVWHERGRRPPSASQAVLAALLAAVGLHTLWDWSPLPVPYNLGWMLLVGVGGILLLRLILQRAAQEEGRSVAAMMSPLVRADATAPAARCPGCGRRAPTGTRYCPRCGLALRAAA